MDKSLFLPYPGIRFIFTGHDSEFEITSTNYGMIRYAAIAGGKPFSISIESFTERYTSGEIECIFLPTRELINPSKSAEIRRKERYVQAALGMLFYPTALEPLTDLIKNVALEIEDQSPPSARTVSRWIYRYRSNNNNALSLNNQFKSNNYLRFPPEIYQIILLGIHDVYLKPEYRTSKDVQAFILGKCAELGISTEYIPSCRTIQRYINKLDPFEVTKIKKGSQVAKKLFRAAGVSAPSPYVLYVVEIDTHYLDIIVVDPATGEPLGRPFLVCAIDVFSRAIVGTYISMFPPSAMTTLAVIKDMITRPSRGLPGGIPSIIIPDNGVEFKNNALARVCEQLKITITPSQIRDPDNKPHIERFFGTLTKGFFHKLSGTTYSNPQERGSYNSSDKAIFTLDQVKTYADRWIGNVYQQRMHTSTGRAPLALWESAIEHVKPSSLTLTDADIICRRPVERTINHGQVIIDGITYHSHALATLRANGVKKVIVLIDDLDLSKVYIVQPHKKDEVIQAYSTNPDYTKNLSYDVHMEVQKRKKLMSKSDELKYGKDIDLYNWYRLMQDIQADLVKTKPKLKQFKLDLPQRFKELNQAKTREPQPNTANLITLKETTPALPQDSTELVSQSFVSIEVSRNEKF